MTPPARRSTRVDLAARAAAVTAHATPAPAEPTEEQPATAAAPAPATRATAKKAAPRTKPVRITVDLAPVDYRYLKTWTGEAADALGVATVSGSDVMRGLLHTLRADPAVRAAVLAWLREQQT